MVFFSADEAGSRREPNCSLRVSAPSGCFFVIAFMGFVFGGVAFNTVERSSAVYREGIFGNEPNARALDSTAV
jgi:hypothetical protein